jgi:signal transduction histidine kinase
MGDTRDPVSTLRHDLSNPLAAILAEVQLLLLDAEQLPADVVTSLRQIEALARRMRDILQATGGGGGGNRLG